MNKSIPLLLMCFLVHQIQASNSTLNLINYSEEDSIKTIYQSDWIDFNKNGKKDIYEDPTQPIEKRIEDLLSQMTDEEKICQMVTLYGYGRVAKDELPTEEWKNEVWANGLGNIDEPSNGVYKDAKYILPYEKHVWATNEIQKFFVEETRLGIPVEFSNEGIRGLNHKMATSLPAQSTFGNTWDKDLFAQAGDMVGKEAKWLGYHNVYSPVIDVVRDQRWGRAVESLGEDPFLVTEYAIPFVKNMQSHQVAATLKHFAVYAMPKGARDGYSRTDPHVAPREMFNIHLYPFERTIKEGGAMCVMASYNDYDGIPIIANPFFMDSLLRKEYGMKGTIVSDSDAAANPWNKHRVAKDYKESVRQVVQAGLNIRTTFNHPKNFLNPLRELVAEGAISQEVLNERVRTVLYTKFWEGLFDQPYKNEADGSKVRNKQHLEIAKNAASGAVVLLKNEGILPLSKSESKHILIVGPTATQVSSSNSRYGALDTNIKSILDGFKDYLKGSNITIDYCKGSELYDENWPSSEVLRYRASDKDLKLLNETKKKAEKADIIILCVGENEKMIGENLSRSSLDLLSTQQHLAYAMIDTGKPLVAITVNGRPISINDLDQDADAILMAGFLNEFQGDVVAETIFGENNPSGKLATTWPKAVGQVQLNFPYKPYSQGGQATSGPNGVGESRVVPPLYHFGYGLSYSTFEYSNLTIDNQLDNNGAVTITCQVKNTSKVDGKEVVQLYYNDVLSSVIQYEWQLRGFEKINLKAGESKKVSFQLYPKDLYVLNKDFKKAFEPGEFKFFIGSSSEIKKLEGNFMYNGNEMIIK
ncbi:beta-glucosidase [Flammeovirga sp. MY04]|uniref:glycoside hydrolase family 3 N-terminal domain-containing protein n=1 Tax=Flammeovirga sp. MY04 TaxID=1191459 RepID=UPI0008060FC3|nr:glycoside hydrolase family 3 N-terminal domain-containing protein [Flammeovirga sp. MY04]ANQ51962.1 beta-glucosidase [Flammeovirga sp. MY04]